MATPAALLIRDQNLDIHFPGGATLGGKTDGSKAQNKGALGSRKALNDISNSSKASSLQVSKKNYSNNVLAIEKDIGAATRTPFAIGGKPNGSKALQKGQSGVRKALSDLTNSGKPSFHQVSKKSQDKIMNAILEENAGIADEGFLHNHHECIKAREKIMDKESFLKLVIRDDGPPFPQPSSKVRPGSPPRRMEMEEMPVPMMEDRVLVFGRRNLGFYSPACLSPVSPRLSSANWKELEEDKSLNFALIESPKLPKQY